MTVTTEINMAICDHKALTGKDATQIYLGRNKMIELLRWADANCFYKVPLKVRPEYNGCKVFEVDADDHLAVA